jgi:hypothetical protein
MAMDIAIDMIMNVARYGILPQLCGCDGDATGGGFSLASPSASFSQPRPGHQARTHSLCPRDQRASDQTRYHHGRRATRRISTQPTQRGLPPPTTNWPIFRSLIIARSVSFTSTSRSDLTPFSFFFFPFLSVYLHLGALHAFCLSLPLEHGRVALGTTPATSCLPFHTLPALVPRLVARPRA